MNNKESRFLKINGKMIPVSEEIYKEYMRPEWREAKYISVNKRSEILIDSENEKVSIRKLRHLSLEKMIDDGVQFEDNSLPFEITIEYKEMLENAIAKLTNKEKDLITHMFYLGYTQVAYAKKQGISQAAVAMRYKNAMKKLKNFLINF